MRFLRKMTFGDARMRRQFCLLKENQIAVVHDWTTTMLDSTALANFPTGS